MADASGAEGAEAVRRFLALVSAMNVTALLVAEEDRLVGHLSVPLGRRLAVVPRSEPADGGAQMERRLKEAAEEDKLCHRQTSSRYPVMGESDERGAAAEEKKAGVADAAEAEIAIGSPVDAKATCSLVPWAAWLVLMAAVTSATLVLDAAPRKPREHAAASAEARIRV